MSLHTVPAEGTVIKRANVCYSSAQWQGSLSPTDCYHAPCSHRASPSSLLPGGSRRKDPQRRGLTTGSAWAFLRRTQRHMEEAPHLFRKAPSKPVWGGSPRTAAVSLVKGSPVVTAIKRPGSRAAGQHPRAFCRSPLISVWRSLATGAHKQQPPLLTLTLTRRDFLSRAF